jgi:hypothetical protein
MCRKGNGMGLLTYGPRAGDKLADPRGAAACRLRGWVQWEWQNGGWHGQDEVGACGLKAYGP